MVGWDVMVTPQPYPLKHNSFFVFIIFLNPSKLLYFSKHTHFSVLVSIIIISINLYYSVYNFTRPSSVSLKTDRIPFFYIKHYAGQRRYPIESNTIRLTA